LESSGTDVTESLRSSCDSSRTESTIRDGPVGEECRGEMDFIKFSVFPEVNKDKVFGEVDNSVNNFLGDVSVYNG
jgi:hypothetical protein